MKKIFIVLCILALVVTGVVAAKDIIIKKSMEGIVNVATGLRISIGSLNTSIIRNTVHIKDLLIFNPPDFPNDEVMLDVPEIYIDCDVKGLLFKKEVYLRNIRLNMKETCHEHNCTASTI